jgi:hypothetical protein
MAELDAIKASGVIGMDGLMYRRTHKKRSGKIPKACGQAATDLCQANP